MFTTSPLPCLCHECVVNPPEAAGATDPKWTESVKPRYITTKDLLFIDYTFPEKARDQKYPFPKPARLNPATHKA